MKSIYLGLLAFGLAAFVLPELEPREIPEQVNSEILGAWGLISENGAVIAHNISMIVTDNHFAIADYNKTGKTFGSTYGGTYSLEGSVFTQNIEFDTRDKNRVGKSYQFGSEFHDKIWITTIDGDGADLIRHWGRIDRGQNQKAPLAGAWRIRERERDGVMTTMQRGPRKTLKMLSATRFQWIAYNSETGEFFGTGGGTYLLKGGKYTEQIEFFSRDNSRVGAELTFNYEVKNGDWHHSGKSSRGDPIYEIWALE